jgi:cell filamentation protein, protein adenylyltransferase
LTLLRFKIVSEIRRRKNLADFIAVSQQGDWENWLCFFLRGGSEQARDSLARMERLQAIRVKYQSIVEDNRNPERKAAVVDFLFTRPIFSIRQVASRLGIPFKTASDYIRKLLLAGVLREMTGYAWNRIYQADEVFNILD